MTQREAIATFLSLGHAVLACGCGALGRWCPRCACLVEIAEATMHTYFSHEEVQAMSAAVIDIARQRGLLAEESLSALRPSGQSLQLAYTTQRVALFDALPYEKYLLALGSLTRPRVLWQLR